MACYRPLRAFRTPGGVVFSELARHDIIGDIELPCGQCIGCRMRRASDWTVRIMHESKSWEANCFVTLTYARDCLPPDGSLVHRDFQLFMKRLRRSLPGRVVRYYMCGEYGDISKRAHFHACLFNVDFQSDRVPLGKSASGALFYDSPSLFKLWSHGRVSVQDLTVETASYCARYIMKKRLGPSADVAYTNEDGVILKHEYACMSLKPGIGASWHDKFGSDVYPRDYVVADGSKRQSPRYYDKLQKRLNKEYLDELEHKRYLRARAVAVDNTDERRAVREAVHLAKVSTLKRGNV